MIPAFGYSEERRSLAVIVLVILSVFSCADPKTMNQRDLIQILNEEDFYWDTKLVDMRFLNQQASWEVDWMRDARNEQQSAHSTLRKRFGSIGFHCRELSSKYIKIRWRRNPTSSKNQTVLFYANEHLVRQEKPPQDFGDTIFFIEENQLRPGLNYLTLFPHPDHPGGDTGIDVKYIQIGKSRSEVQSKSEGREISRNLEWSKIGDSKISVPSSSLIKLYLRVPQNATFEATWGYERNVAPRGSAALFTIYIDNGKQKRKIASGVVKDRWLFSPEGELTLNLSEYAEQIVSIELESHPIEEKSDPILVYWKDINVNHVPEKLEKKDDAKKLFPLNRKPNVILYVIDALRPDHLESYGYRKSTSAEIKKFTKKSVLFANSYAQSSWTRAAIASLQTGLHPSSHLTEGRRDTLPDYLPTIQTELKKHGYVTYGFATNGNISHMYHFSRGFDQYLQLWESSAKKHVHSRSDELVQTIEQLLLKSNVQPKFLYIHASDPHAPYTPEQAFLKTTPNCNIDQVAIYKPNVRTFGIDFYNRRILQCIMELYDSEVRQSDHYFGRLIQFLKEQRLYRNSLIILTSDHGEEFLDHGEMGHGRNLYQASIRVPLMIHFPDETFSGTNVSSIARHIDIFPTILDVVGVKHPEGIEGASLLSLVATQSQHNRPVFAELALDGPPVKSLILNDYKLISMRGKILPPIKNHEPIDCLHYFKYFKEYELYQLRDDPYETVNLIQKEPIRSGHLRKLMNDWTVLQEKKSRKKRKGPNAIVSEEMQEVLRGLGYIQ